MAGDWIKIRIDLHTDPSVIAMSEALGLSPDAVVGALVRFWSWVSWQLRDCRVQNVTVSWLNRYIGIENFGQMLEKVGWLVIEKDGLKIPHFDRHLSKGAKQRALATLNRAIQRSRECRDDNATKRRPEKRREDDDDASASSLRDDDEKATSNARSDLVEEITLKFPMGYHKAFDVVDKVGVTAEDLPAWEAFAREKGMRLAVWAIQRFKNPSQMPQAQGGDGKPEWKRVAEEFLNERDNKEAE